MVGNQLFSVCTGLVTGPTYVPTEHCGASHVIALLVQKDIRTPPEAYFREYKPTTKKGKTAIIREETPSEPPNKRRPNATGRGEVDMEGISLENQFEALAYHNNACTEIIPM